MCGVVWKSAGDVELAWLSAVVSPRPLQRETDATGGEFFIIIFLLQWYSIILPVRFFLIKQNSKQRCHLVRTYKKSNYMKILPVSKYKGKARLMKICSLIKKAYNQFNTIWRQQQSFEYPTTIRGKFELEEFLFSIYWSNWNFFLVFIDQLTAARWHRSMYMDLLMNLFS